jgi:hypothetical protein
MANVRRKAWPRCTIGTTRSRFAPFWASFVPTWSARSQRERKQPIIGRYVDSRSPLRAQRCLPFLTRNLVGFPDDALEVEVLAEILRGGAEKANEAGIRHGIGFGLPTLPPSLAPQSAA